LARNAAACVTFMAPALVGACHQATASPRTTPDDRLGAYDYRANVGRFELRGVIVVLEDTVMLRPATEYCEPVMGPSDLMSFRFRCVGSQDFESVVLRIDRRNPAMASKWVATFIERRRRTVCARYGINERGQTVCVETRIEYYDAKTTQSGPLRTRRTSESSEP
jgi:hypothetical protein